MPLLSAQNLHKSFGDRDILADVSFSIEHGERIGLVGINGAGKSTLAQIIAGSLEPDSGSVVRERGLSVAYLTQDPSMDGGKNAREVVLAGLTAWHQARAQHTEITQALEHADDSQVDVLLKKQASAATAIERAGGWDMDYQAEMTLGHLGITTLDKAVGQMSGGERRRVALARLLVARPALAIIDEPTNHLDIPTIEWLEDYLRNQYDGATLLVTHDRSLLDAVVSRTVELEHGVLYSYQGGWTDYLEAQAERHATADRAEANRQNFLRRELEWLRRQPKARTGKQKARVDRANAALDRDGPGKMKKAGIAIGETRSGKTILEAENLRVEIAGKTLVDRLTLKLGKGERIGVVGPNGAGKTTLLRTLLGEHPPAAGRVVIGTNTRIAYLDQARANLDDDKSIFDNISGGQTHVKLGEQTLEMRSYIKRFLFEVPQQIKLVGRLSGGERARVALARVLREPANVVVLDEPTNDLDVATLSALEASLLDFGGTLIVVTHDRWFLNRIATSILGFRGQGDVVRVHGGYDSYQNWCDAEAAEAATDATTAPPSPVKSIGTSSDTQASTKKASTGLTFTEKHELKALMPKIEEAEAEVGRLATTLESIEFANMDYPEQADIIAEHQAASALAETLIDRWTELEAKNEAN